MSDDRQKEQRLKAAGDLFKGFASSIGVFVKAAKAEYKKDRSGFRAHRQGQLKQQLNKGIATGLKASRAALEPAIAQGFKVTRELLEQKVEPIVNKGLEAKREIQAQVQNIPQAAVDIANNISQSIQPQSNGQTADQAFKQGLQMIDADEKKKEQGLENFSDDFDQKQAEPEIERPKVQDELLYSDGKFMDGITKEDILAIAELITAQKGDKLQGEAAKGLTIEYNGEILLKTDRDGRVDTNRLNDQDLMSKFDSRATAEIAEFQAQAEELKRELKASISQDSLDRKTLETRVDGKSTAADKDFSNAEKQTPVVLDHNSPQGTQALQDIGSKRLPVIQQGEQQPQVSQSIKPLQSIVPQSNIPQGKLDRMAKVASTAFIQNYKGDRNNGPIQGRVQAPDSFAKDGTIVHGAIIERTPTQVTQGNGQGFDLSVEKNGVRHEVASYADGKFTIKEGMIGAVPAIEEISSNIDIDGKFTPTTVVPQLEKTDQAQAQTQEVQQEPVTVGGDDGR